MAHKSDELSLVINSGVWLAAGPWQENESIF